MNQDELYKGGHPSTWQVGDIIAAIEDYSFDACRWSWKKDVEHAIHSFRFNERDYVRTHKEAPSIEVSRFRLVRRANAEGSGECQSRSHMPDSAGATPAPSTNVIEQKPVCACCTFFMYPNVATSEPIRHDDPCEYSHLERYMLPIARAQFRERQKQKIEQETKEAVARADAIELRVHEMRHARGSEIRESAYARLTGHNFKDE